MAGYAQPLHIHERFNPEEAAHAAAEFVASLDNLPGEVTHLLEEIKEKDVRINRRPFAQRPSQKLTKGELLARINQRHFGLTKHARSTITSSKDKDINASGSTTPPFALPLPPGTPLPTAHLSSKDAQALTKIASEFAKVQALQDEKIALAERMERIVGRARERGRAEWLKVGGMDLEEVQKLREEGEIRGREEIAGGMVMLPSMGLGAAGERPKSELSYQAAREVLTAERKPTHIPIPPTYHPAGHTVHPPPQHSAMMPPPAPTTRGPGRRRGDRHQSSTSRFSESEYPAAASDVYDPDADAEGEEYDMDADGEGEVDAEMGEAGDGDDELYCVCRQKSYGEMIGCDAPDCDIEWFHVKCVGVTGALPDTWYCPECVIKLGMSGSNGRTAGRDKKGRKAR